MASDAQIVVRAEGGFDIFCQTCGVWVPGRHLFITGQHGATEADRSDHKVWDNPSTKMT